MSTDSCVYLHDILESISLIEVYTESLTREAFLDSREKQDAVIRRLEVIGEATRNLPNELTEAHPEVPWSPIIAMRNRLIHAYGRVDLELTWEVVERELPKLKAQVRVILGCR